MSRVLAVVVCLLLCLPNSKTFDISPHVNVVLCKWFATFPEKDNKKVIYAIFGDASEDVEFLRQLETPIVVETIANLSDIGRRRDFNLIFISDDAQLRKFHAKYSSTLFNSHGFYVVVANRVDIFEWFWEKQILNVNVVSEVVEGSVAVFSYFPFNSHECGNTQPTLVNSTEPFFPDKLSNLFGCEVRLATSKISQPYVFVESASDGSIMRLYGRDMDLIAALSQAIKFHAQYVYVGVEGALWSDGRAEGPFELLLANKTDLIIADYWLMPSRLRFIDSTLPYSSSHIAFIVPPGAPYSSFRKLLLPFDVHTWLALISISAISLVVIFGARRRMSKRQQSWIFGISSSDPYMNLIRAILGGSQKIVPKSSSGRVLLTAMLVVCLVLRTVYLGSLYRFLQKSIKHKEVQSVDEMVERDFSVYYLTSVKDLMENTSSRLRDRLIGVTIAQRTNIISQVYNPSFKGAFLRSLTGIQYINQHNHHKGELYTVCKENFMTIPVVIYTRKDFYLVDKIDEKIQQIQAAGLIDYWHSQWIDRKYSTATDSGKPMKLSMSHLLSCFTVWMFGLIIAFIIFMAENCKFRLMR